MEHRSERIRKSKLRQQMEERRRRRMARGTSDFFRRPNNTVQMFLDQRKRDRAMNRAPTPIRTTSPGPGIDIGPHAGP